VLLAEQVAVFMWTLVIGMLAGLCHVIYRVISDMVRLKRIGTFAGDIIFWVFLTAVAFSGLLKANYGEMRLYVFIGLFLGAFLFNRFLGGFFYRLIRWMFYSAGRVLRLLALFFYYSWKVLTFPFRIVFITVIFPVRLFGRALGRAGRFAGKITGRFSSRARGKISNFTERLLKSLSRHR